MLGPVILITASCGQRPSPRTQPFAAPSARGQAKPAIVAGIVKDSTTDDALPGAIVEWTSGTRHVQGATDANGNYAFAIPLPKNDGRPKDLAVAISAWSNLYEVSRQSIGVHSGAAMTLNFALEGKPPAEIGSIHGRATDAEAGQGKSGVAVSIMGAGADLNTVTEADGSYTFPQVGLGRFLVIRAITQAPPCFIPVERSIGMFHAAAIVDFPLKRVATDTALTCPTDAAPTQLRRD